MSDPPSPSRTLANTTSAGQSHAASTTTTAGQSLAFPPTFVTSLPTTEPSVTSTYGSDPSGSVVYKSVASPTFSAPSTTAEHRAPPPEPDPDTALGRTLSGPSGRGGRRAKTHVASACINCKRAHLSCDVQRPCSRCVSSGKQDTCVDVQHKKRGRPRLREEGEFRTLGAGDSSPPEPAVAGPSQVTPRPIAQTRQRRADSYRSLRSQASDDSASVIGSTPGRGMAGPLQSPYAIRPPTATTQAPQRYEVATALLNTDFIIVRANQPFDQIMNQGGSTRGRHIGELAVPADNDDMQNVRNRLRAEREARDPAYMPPILQPGQDPVLHIPESEAEQFAHSFNDDTYTWRHAQHGPQSETFPARVRLAKTSIYFVVLTLPSFRPVEAPPQSLPPPTAYSSLFGFGPPLPSPEPFAMTRQSALHSAPPQTLYRPRAPSASSSTLLPSAPHGSATTYPPPHPLIPFQHPQPRHVQPPPLLTRPHTPSRLLPREPPTDTTAFTPRSMPTEIARGMGEGDLVLPPLSQQQQQLQTQTRMIPGSGTGIGSGTLGAAMGMRGTGSSEDEEEGGDRTRRGGKRRRMGIDEVLQR
ncbi:hypothetical protein LTR62_003929 [Meristemomyces frigidus]|uniref:Zn(2)-C6 fungal-type domain-containing protein n=1 Tax=Meristemomyces frigidus TaxID=1508187 RepID=A0AAN7TI64_9PEZI|nr:hypothetical protein LTR62_003929 [Meristemomyces frigidus]